jgi:uncharacterized protein (TIGR02145 family)
MFKRSLHQLIIILLLISVSGIKGQNTLSLTFTGINNTDYVQLDSIRIKNLTQGEDTLLIYPDTVLIFNYVGINEPPLALSGFNILQNFPNPVKDWTTINFYIPEKENVTLNVTDLLGRSLISVEKFLDKGQHSFRFTPSGERIYLFTVSWKEFSRTIKIMNMSYCSGGDCSLEHTGSEKINLPIKSSTALRKFSFSPGDELMVIGYADDLEAGFCDSPEASTYYSLQFATNIPCPGMDSIQYEGQWYHTIQIFGQCWMKENLNVGAMISHMQEQTDNAIIEKYCMDNSGDFCATYGGLYTWNEMMNYTYRNNGQGICPDGWHIPGDTDWQVLEGAVDSTYGIGEDAWKYNGWRGSDAGGNLKSKGTSHWNPPNTGATDNFGFAALPAGYIVQNGFWGLEYKAYFWSSHPFNQYFRNIDWNQVQVQRNNGDDEVAISVRCIRD